MRLNLLILMLLAGAAGQAASLQSEFAIGRAFYTEGEFKKAAAHFELALKMNPNDADTCHWTGMAYQAMADIAAPLDHKYNSRARVYLTESGGTGAKSAGLPPGIVRLSLGFYWFFASPAAAGDDYSPDSPGIRSGL